MSSEGRNRIRRDDKPQGVGGELRSLLNGLIAAALVALTVLVAVVLGVQEQDLLAIVEPSATRALPTPTATVTPLPKATSLPSPTDRTALLPTVSSTALPARAISTLPPTSSPIPTLYSTVQVIQSTRVPDTYRPCEKRTDWRVYVVVKGDTLSSLARRTDSSVSELKRGNCLASDTIYAGQRLRVPKVPYSPAPTHTPVPPTASPTETATEPPPPTDRPTDPPPPTDRPTDPPTPADTPTDPPPRPSPEPPTPTP